MKPVRLFLDSGFLDQFDRFLLGKVVLQLVAHRVLNLLGGDVLALVLLSQSRSLGVDFLVGNGDTLVFNDLLQRQRNPSPDGSPAP